MKFGVLRDPNETREDRRWSALLVATSLLVVVASTSLDLSFVQSMFAVGAAVFVAAVGTAIRFVLMDREKS